MQIVKKYGDRLISIAISLCLIIISFFTLPLPSIAATTAPDWGYEGKLKPDNWGKISREFATCDRGKSQSPIDISGAATGEPIEIEFDYKPSPLTVVNNGHSIQVNYAPGSKISIGGEDYQLLQFHFHTPSEHQIAGVGAAMEAHLVHRNDAGKLAVVGVMINAERENREIAKIWDAIPLTGRTNKIANISIDADRLLPKEKSYFSYTGSLTTPPCSEDVNWIVLTEPLTISNEQIERFQMFYPIDARPVQSTNARKIELHGEV